MSAKKGIVWDEEWLRQKYEVERLTMKEIAAEKGCCIEQVWYTLQKFKIKSRSTGHKGGTPTDYGDGEASMYRFPRETAKQSAMWQRLIDRARNTGEVA